MGFSTSSWYNDRVYKFVTLLFLVLPLTFLIIAASLHNLYSFNAADLGVPQDQLSGSAHFGAFYGCVDMDGIFPSAGGEANVAFSMHQCVRIKADCTVHLGVTVNGEYEEIDTDLGPQWNCSQYNAFRAFLIIAIIFLGFAIITCMLSLMYNPQSHLLLWLTVAFNSLAIISTIVSWGLVADHWKTQNVGGDWFKRGPAFGLVVTAFVLMVVAMILYGVVWRIESVGYSKSDSSSVKQQKVHDTASTDATEGDAV